MKPLVAIPFIILLILRAYTRNSLTPTGLVLAFLTASLHSLHPSALPFTLLGVFFLLGTTATKIKHDVKATLTVSSTGAGGEGPRHAIQVLANSGVASLLVLWHVVKFGADFSGGNGETCFGNGAGRDLLLLGVVANYAAVTADTLSSELGILSKGRPRLITSLRSVPPGTNGGVTLAGLLAGAGGAGVIGLVSVLMLDFCDGSASQAKGGPVWGRFGGGFGNQVVSRWSVGEKVGFWVAVMVWGALGSMLDSLLGAVLQASVVDKRTGKVVEGAGGKKVLVARNPSRKGGDETKEGGRSIGSGRDLLDNNQINVLMALIMSIGGLVVGGKVINVDVSTLVT